MTTEDVVALSLLHAGMSTGDSQPNWNCLHYRDRWFLEAARKHMPALLEATREVERLHVRVEAAEEALRSLASYLSVGGYNAETVDAQAFERKIRDGIAVLVRPLTDERDRLKAHVAELEDIIPVTCGACGHTISISDGTCGCDDNRRHPVASIRRSILDGYRNRIDELEQALLLALDTGMSGETCVTTTCENAIKSRAVENQCRELLARKEAP